MIKLKRTPNTTPVQNRSDDSTALLKLNLAMIDDATETKGKQASLEGRIETLETKVAALEGGV